MSEWASKPWRVGVLQEARFLYGLLPLLLKHQWRYGSMAATGTAAHRKQTSPDRNLCSGYTHTHTHTNTCCQQISITMGIHVHVCAPGAVPGEVQTLCNYTLVECVRGSRGTSKAVHSLRRIAAVHPLRRIAAVHSRMKVAPHPVLNR